MQEVFIPSLSLEQFAPLVRVRRAEQMRAAIRQAQDLLRGRTLWNINSTAMGGGVAEMLQTLLAYGRGCGINVRWLVIRGDAEFFTITKRIHNYLHGSRGDGGPLGEREHRHYADVVWRNADTLRTLVKPDDIVILHDPQTAGLIPAMGRLGARVIWRCHVGRDTSNEETEQGWTFLRPYLEKAHAFIFSRAAYVPSWMEAGRVFIIAPSIDAFSIKNQPLSPPTVRAILTHMGLLRNGAGRARPVFYRPDGSRIQVRRRAEVLHSGFLPGPDVPLVVQVSRWDRLKDMVGVMWGFVEELNGYTEAYLVLAGPDVRGVADDPEGKEALEECIEVWRRLPEAKRSRVGIVCLPMADVEENAAMVNALQRHASVVVQKSLQEGFGLTVTEAMWKGRPIVASAVGGIQDQIVHGKHGLLLKDPTDLEAFGQALGCLLESRELAQRLGRSARRRVLSQFLAPRHLTQYVDLLYALEQRVAPPPWQGTFLSDKEHPFPPAAKAEKDRVYGRAGLGDEARS